MGNRAICFYLFCFLYIFKYKKHFTPLSDAFSLSRGARVGGFVLVRGVHQVGTSTMGLLVMHVGLHTMIRSTVPVFVLMFSVGIGLQV